MLYVEAVLYLMVAIVAFSLGYLFGRGGSTVVSKDDTDVQNRVPLEGKVLVGKDTKLGDEGAVVVVVPEAKITDKLLPTAGLQPHEGSFAADDPALVALHELGGNATRTNPSGDFTLFVPVPGSYRVLIISGQATRRPDGPRYFDSPRDLLKDHSYRWMTKELHHGPDPINIEFSE